MSDYLSRRQKIENIRFCLICLCIIGAIVMLFAACTPKPIVVSGPRVLVHDTVRVVQHDTIEKVITLPPVVVHDTIQTVHTDTVRVQVTNVIRDTVQVHDTTVIIRERKDTLVLRDTLTLRDTLRLVIRDTVVRHDSTFIFYPVHDTVVKTITLHDTTKVTVFVPVHDTVIVRDSLHPKMILPVDTVFMRVGDPPISFQYGDSIKIQVRVLPKCSCSVPIDTIEHQIPAGLTPAQAGVDTIGLHIYDWPSRVGDNSVFFGNTMIGRLLQGSSPSEWFVYRSVAGQMEMPRDPNPYPSKLEAMKALLPSS